MKKEGFGSAAAADEGDAAAAPALGVLCANERDRRALAWLRERASDEQIAAAVASLAGNRKPYISNISKALGLQIPDSIVRTPKEIGLQRIRVLKQLLTVEAGC